MVGGRMAFAVGPGVGQLLVRRVGFGDHGQRLDGIS